MVEDRELVEKFKKKLPLTDSERLARFKSMGKELDADESPEAFDRAFASIVPTPKPKS